MAADKDKAKRASDDEEEDEDEDEEGNKEDDEEEPAPAKPQKTKGRRVAEGVDAGDSSVEIDVIGPLTFWIMALVIGVILALLLGPLAASVGYSRIASMLESVSGYILYLPGALILPLIVAFWIGERIGAAKGDIGSAVRLGVVNAAYAALIYVIAIFVVYLLLKYIAPAFLAAISLNFFVEYVVVVPVVIVVALIPGIAALSAARHSSR